MGAAPPKTQLDTEYRKMVSDLLTAASEKFGWDQSALGAALGVNRTTALRYLNGTTRAPVHNVKRLEDRGIAVPETLEIAFDSLKGVQRKPKLLDAPATAKTADPSRAAQRRKSDQATLASDSVDSVRATKSMPIISTVAAGQLTDPSIPIEGGHQTIEISGLPPGDYFATRVEGTSMNRISPPGSLIVVNRAERELIRGRRYIFGRRGATTYKRFEHSPLRLEPETTEPESNPIIFPNDEEEWTVIGRVRLTLLDDL